MSGDGIYERKNIFINKIRYKMNSKGITYFRLTSPYEGDVTKNCSLDGYEVDNNFFTLEGRDIETVYVEDDEIKIGLKNGNVIKSGDVFSNFAKDLSFDFDAENGILYVTNNGVTKKIEGFITSFSNSEPVATNETLTGKGIPSSPMGVSKSFMTGKYRPVKMFIDMAKDCCVKLPSGKGLKVGDRYLVLENVSEYGMLYNYDAVKRIACDLASIHSEWRIPTKEDWDDMLNAVEPCAEDKDHNGVTCNKYFGRYAGRMLKSVDGWKKENGCKQDTDTCFMYTSGCDCTCGKEVTECSPVHCGEYSSCSCKPCDNNHDGIDKYGFKIMPAGYADDGNNPGYFGERAYFWTATNSNNGHSAFIKRFEYNKANVYQDVMGSKNSLSLRLVKDYNGNNFHGNEVILGTETPSVLMPSIKKGHAVWTKVNIAFANKAYKPTTPNCGCHAGKVKVYSIYEWDGDKWMVNTFNEGDTVVILDAPNGKYATEYQLVLGDLIDLTTKVTDVVFENIDQKLDDIEDNITGEADRAKGAEKELNDRIDAINDDISAKTKKFKKEIEDLGTKIGTETDERVAADEKIQGDLSQLNENVVTAINTINQNVADGFNEINKNVADGFNTINKAIQDETDARIAEDKKLGTSIETIDGQLITTEGTLFDPETGKITLKSKGGDNDIEIQLMLNMGHF